MTTKKYWFFRLLIVILLSSIFSISISMKNYIIPTLAAITAAILLWSMKKKVNAVMADEMDFQIAGHAARYAILIFASASTILALYFMVNRAEGNNFELLGSVLAYSACAIMIAQGLIFKFLKTKNYVKNDNKN